MSSGLFVDFKKGEILELKQQLRDPAIDRDKKAKRQVSLFFQYFSASSDVARR